MILTEKRKGRLIVSIASLCFTYFTLWIIIVPLLEEDSAALLDRWLFPVDRYYALAVPTVIGVIMCSTCLVGLGVILVHQGLKGETKKSR